MKYDNKSFQERYEAWKNGADYWKDIRGINLGGGAQEEPSEEEQKELDSLVTNILSEYNRGKGSNGNDSISSFVGRIGPLVGRALNRYGYGESAYYNIMRLLAYESNYGTSNIARKQHNYGGVGFNGKTYTTYKSDEDFVNNYIDLMRNKYDSALRAKTTQDYARELKQRGYYQDTLLNYTRNLMGMNTLAKTAFNHRKKNPDMYNYNVQFSDLVKDFDDARNASPIILGTPSIELPLTINATIPRTLLGPVVDLNKLGAENLINRKLYEEITTPTLPNILNLLPTNNFGKDTYGLKFWLRKNNNLHFDEGKDERIAGSNPLLQDKINLDINLELGLPKNYFPYHTFIDSDGFGYTLTDFYDAGLLDDVVVKPSKYDKKLLDITRRMFPNKYVRDLVYNDTLYSDPTYNTAYNDRLLNMILLYKLSGSPSISNKSKSKFNIIRSNYIPYYNHINSTPGSLIDELAHAYLYNNQISKPMIVLDNKTSRGSDYKRKGSIEHLAHKTILPNLEEFIKSGNRKYLNKAITDANKEYKLHGNWLWDEGKDPYLYKPNDYDFVQARDLGYKAGPDGHWPSRNYKTGRYLKLPTHPTLYKGIISDNSLGYYPYYKDGAIYTNTWKCNEPYAEMLENYIQYRYGKSKKKTTKAK